MATRISSCCEYRYAPGFQQGRKSCFRLTWLAGGIPCYRSDFIRLLEGEPRFGREVVKIIIIKITSLNKLSKPNLRLEEKRGRLHNIREWCWCWGRNTTHDESTFFIFFFRCTSLRNKYSSCQQLNNGTKENLILPLEQNTGNGTKLGNECLNFPLLPKAYSSIRFDIEPSPWFHLARLKTKCPRKCHFLSFCLCLLCRQHRVVVPSLYPGQTWEKAHEEDKKRRQRGRIHRQRGPRWS